VNLPRPGRRLLLLATLLAWTLLGAGVVLGVAVAGPIAWGWRPLAVLSGSMAPTLETGDEIIVRRRLHRSRCTWATSSRTTTPPGATSS
jgi:signal peptidase I